MGTDKYGNDSEKMSALFPDVEPLKVDDYYYENEYENGTGTHVIGIIKDKETHEPISYKFSEEYYSEEEVGDFRRDDVPTKTIKNLRRCQWPVERTIDLHGLTRTEATIKLARFMAKSTEEKCRCLMIIHGRGRQGQSPLRSIVRRGLKMNTHSVLAFCSAPPKLGGSGATLVLLKKYNHCR